MPISLIDKIKPKNNGSFALVDAADVEMPDGKRLSEWEGGGGDIATSIDLSKFDTQGQIEETFEDGSKVTTTLQFDTNGNPVKITDSNGNVTTLTW